MKRNVFLAFVLIFGSAIAYLILKSPLSPSKPKSALESLLESDRKMLRDRSALEKDLVPSLMRLSEVQDPEAKQRLIEMAKLPEATSRSQAALSLGFFTDKESNQLLAELLRDENTDVRLAVLRGLRLKRSPERAELFSQVLNNTRSSISERVLAVGGKLHIMGPKTPKEFKDPLILELFEAYNSPQLQDPNLALNEILAFAPRDLRSLEIVENVLDGTTPTETSTPLLTSAIRGLRWNCSPRRRALMERILSFKEHPQLQRTALQELNFMKKEEALEVLDLAIERNWLPSEVHPKVGAIRSRIVDSKSKDPCASRSK